MSHRMISDAELLCTFVGAFTLYVVVVGAAASLIIRRAKARVPHVGPSPLRRTAERRATGWNDMSGWQTRDKDWAVVAVLLGAHAIAGRTEAFVDFPGRQVDWPGLMLEADQWAKPDRLLVHVAYDLVTQAGDAPAGNPVEGVQPVTVIDLATDIDQPRTDLIRAAVDLRRGACTYEHARKVSAKAA